MRSDQCYFCQSRRCHLRIVSSKDNGKTYDEVACDKHFHDLEKDSDERAPKVMKLFHSICGGTVKRGVDISEDLERMEASHEQSRSN